MIADFLLPGLSTHQVPAPVRTVADPAYRCVDPESGLIITRDDYRMYLSTRARGDYYIFTNASAGGFASAQRQAALLMRYDPDDPDDWDYALASWELDQE